MSGTPSCSKSYVVTRAASRGTHGRADVVVPLRYRRGNRELAFFSMTAVVGTPMDVTIEELAIESFYPADGQRPRLYGLAISRTHKGYQS